MKKLLATFLCAVMVLTMAPASVFAANSDTTELQNLIDTAADGSTITLTKNYETDGIVVIKDKNITIDGGNYTVTTTSKKAFEIRNTTDVTKNVTLKNMDVVNKHAGTEAGPRGVDTRNDNIVLILDNINVDVSTAYGNSSGYNPQGIVVGGSDTGTTTIKVTNGSTVNAGNSGYGIITFVKTDLTIQDSSASAGFAALYIKEGSDNSVVTVKGSTLTGTNIHSGISNEFSTVTIEGVKGVKVNITEGSTVSATATGDQLQKAFGFNLGFGTGTACEGNSVNVDGTSTVNADSAEELADITDENTVAFAVGSKSNVTIPAEFLPANAEQDANGVVVEKTTTTPGGNEGTPAPAPETEKKPENSPKTGDNSNMMPYVGFMAVAMMIMAGAVLTRRQTQK